MKLEFLKYELKQSILNIVFGVVLIGVIIAYVVISGRHETALINQQVEIQELANQLEMKKVSAQQAVDNVKKTATGLNTERVTKDDAIAKKFLESCMEWSSYEEYNAIRENLKTEYKLADDSSFLKSFMPEVELIESADGTTYNIIDDGSFSMPDGLNVHYAGMKSYVTNITNDVYSYLAEVTLTTEVVSGSTTSQCVFLYQIDGDGVISGIEGYVLN